MNTATAELEKLAIERCNFDLRQHNPPPRLRISQIADKCGVTEELVVERIRELKGPKP